MNVSFFNINIVLFTVLPYVAIFVFFLITIQRYLTTGFSYSSLSSQFLENKRHFFGLVPFHYGILTVLFGHLVAFLFPRQLLLFNSIPVRLYILEVTALIFGLLTLVGLIAIITRRRSSSKVRIVSSPTDWIVLTLLVIQVAGGIYQAVFHPWGSSWFASAMTPYLWSLIKFNPEITYVIELPFMVKLHVVNAFLIIGIFPFTRLVHILVTPNPYLWRKPQVVRWYRRQGARFGE